MINQRPNNKSYHQGNYIPTNKDKVLKLNGEGGVYYRSSWERILYNYLDHNEDIIQWAAEGLSIPYQRKHKLDGVITLKSHTYYPDIVYTQKMADGSINKVVAEIKPQKEYEMATLLDKGELELNESKLNTAKKIKNYQYTLNQAYINKCKWNAAIKWCDQKGYKFIVITEEALKQKFGRLR